MSTGARSGSLLHTATKTVPTGAAEVVVAAAAGNDSPRRAPNGVMVKALSTNTVLVYIGGSDVTTSNGHPLAAGEWVVFDHIADPSLVYCISGSSSQVLRVTY